MSYWQQPSATHLAAAINLLLTLCYMAGIYWLSSIPGEADPESTILSDMILWTPPAIQNLAHIPLFGFLALLWHRSLSSWMKNGRLLYFSAFLLATGFGILDEWHQLYVPGRYASLTDMALNALGAAFAVWLVSRPARTTRQFPV